MTSAVCYDRLRLLHPSVFYPEFQLRQLDQPGGVVEKTAQLSANEGLTKCQFQLRHVLLEPTPFLA